MNEPSAPLAIEPNFVRKYFPECNPSFIIIYFSLKYLTGTSGECALSQAADFLNCMESDVVRAINFWEQRGVLKSTPIPGRLHFFRFEFFDAGTAAETPVQLALDAPSDTSEAETAAAAAPAVVPKTAIAEMRPNYSVKEIDFYLDNNEEVKNLFKLCQQQMGKLLTHNDMSSIFSLHDWLRLPIPVIELLVEYCCANGHRSMRYIEKVAVTWADAQIDTIDKAKQRIKLYNKDFRAIMSALGKTGREPTKAEEVFMIRWLKTYRLPMEIVLAACERTVLQASRPTFQYCDGILERWHTMGVQTLAEVEAAEADFKSAKTSAAEEKTAKKRKSVKTTKFSNFTERQDTDYAKLQQLEMERIDRELNNSI